MRLGVSDSDNVLVDVGAISIGSAQIQTGESQKTPFKTVSLETQFTALIIRTTIVQLGLISRRKKNPSNITNFTKYLRSSKLSGSNPETKYKSNSFLKSNLSKRACM